MLVALAAERRRGASLLLKSFVVKKAIATVHRWNLLKLRAGEVFLVDLSTIKGKRKASGRSRGFLPQP